MLPYTVYNEGGGVGKTTISATLADAHTRLGQDVLVIDFDSQYGSLSHLLGVDADREDSEQDDLTLHIIDKPMGDFEDLIETTEAGFDVIPSHNRLGNLSTFLDNAGETEESIRQDTDYTYPRYEQLYNVIAENNVGEDYDVLIIDPNAKADDNFYSAVYATQNIVMPVEPSGKGTIGIEGLRQEVDGLSQELGIDVGVLAAIPNDLNLQTNNDTDYLNRLEGSEFDVPAAISNRRSLFRGCWNEQVTAFQYVEEVRDRVRDREVETLEKFETIARHVNRETGNSVETDTQALKSEIAEVK